MAVRLAVRADLDDGELSQLHALPFGGPLHVRAWRRQLAAHRRTWVTAHEQDGELVGLVNVAWDGGVHAFLLDAVVRPDRQHDGLGTALARRGAAEAATAGCDWLHVDFEDRLGGFYLDACGFTSTAAGLLRLRNRA